MTTIAATKTEIIIFAFFCISYPLLLILRSVGVMIASSSLTVAIFIVTAALTAVIAALTFALKDAKKNDYDAILSEIESALGSKAKKDTFTAPAL